MGQSPGPEDTIGASAPGKRPILSWWIPISPTTSPGDWATHLVYSGHSGDVDSVWVNGRKLMEKKELLTIDLTGFILS